MTMFTFTQSESFASQFVSRYSLQVASYLILHDGVSHSVMKWCPTLLESFENLQLVVWEKATPIQKLCKRYEIDILDEVYIRPTSIGEKVVDLIEDCLYSKEEGLDLLLENEEYMKWVTRWDFQDLFLELIFNEEFLELRKEVRLWKAKHPNTKQR